MTHSYKDAKYFDQRGKFCTEFSRLSCNQKMTNRRYFYRRHMKNLAVSEEASAGEVPRDGIGELHAAPSLPGKPRDQEMNHLLIWLQMSFGKDTKVSH